MNFLHFLMLITIVIILISDSDVQLISQIHSFIIENAKRALVLFVWLKWFFGEVDFAHSFVPEYY